MIWGWTIFHGALTLLALRAVWRTDYAGIGAALVANVAFTVAATAIWPHPEVRGAVNSLADIPVLVLATVLLFYAPRIAMMMMVLSTISIGVSAAFSIAEQYSSLGFYNLVINLLVDARCLVLIGIGVWNVVDDRAGDLFRVPDPGWRPPLRSVGVQLETNEESPQ